MNLMTPREVVTALISSLWPWLERCHINSQQTKAFWPATFCMKMICHIFCTMKVLELTWNWDKARRCGDKCYRTGSRGPKAGPDSYEFIWEVTLVLALPQAGSVEQGEEETWASVLLLPLGSQLEPWLSKWWAWSTVQGLRWGSRLKISELQGSGHLQRPCLEGW